MCRFFSVLILIITYHLLLTTEASASGEFSISYDNIYEVDANGNLNVKQDVKITNLTTQFYAAEFTISIGNVKAEKVTASDEAGPIQADINFANNQTSIKLKFNTPIVGKGQTKNFSLNYSAPELINKAGQILEVSIPKLLKDINIDQFNVTLSVPAKFGPVAFISPQPLSTQTASFEGVNQYFFDKSQLLESGVSAAFGEKQFFSFSLIYHLLSPKTTKTEIAIPADNPYQKILIEKMNPEPVDVRVDSDGNWLALYELEGGKQKDITVYGFAEVYPQPKFKLNGQNNLEKYLQPAQYWEVNDAYFGKKAKELKTPKEIYDFVTSFLSYNQERLTQQTVGRIGALGATTNPKNAVCMEFTDLFITLARAADIPAREVNGYAVSANERLRPLSLRNLGGDVLHAWPEFWDGKEQVWIQVDPTWGSTSGGLDYFSKMDFNHIAFVHKGLSSTYPIPAGGYKIDKTKSGDVQVEFAKKTLLVTFEPKIAIEIPTNFLSGFSTKGKILVKNLSNQAISSNPVRIITTNLILKTPAEINLGTLPPQASREIEIQVESTGLLTHKKGQIKALWGPASTTAEVQIRPSLFFGLIIALATIVLFSSATFGAIFVFRKLARKTQI